jgi:hypothetical protein
MASTRCEYATATSLPPTARGGFTSTFIGSRTPGPSRSPGAGIWRAQDLGGRGYGQPPASPSTVIYFDPAGTIQDDIITDQHGLDVADPTMPYIAKALVV